MVIVTGATGSGKTTTLAMIVNLLNQAGGYRIITVEEPVEYLFPRVANSVVTQREVGSDVLTFADGLKYGLRQDPDVILVGEIRDRETAQMALSAAETGHLVFTTLHTRDAKGAITRYADLFPQDVQRDVRAQLALSLRAIVAQRLLPDVERGAKRHLALEVLWNTYPIASAIRTGKVESIDNYLLTSREDGMLSFDGLCNVMTNRPMVVRVVPEAVRFTPEKPRCVAKPQSPARCNEMKPLCHNGGLKRNCRRVRRGADGPAGRRTTAGTEAYRRVARGRPRRRSRPRTRAAPARIRGCLPGV
jgi:twitching motility protein PilT